MDAKKTTRQKIFSSKWLPFVLLALNIYFFFCLVPPHIAEAYSTVLAILGGVITLVLFFWILIFVTPKLLDKAPILMGLLGISTLFIFGYFFIMRASDFFVKEIQKNGVHTVALITDKTRLYGKRGNTIQSIEVRFTVNKKAAHATISVSERDYNDLEEGMQVPIVYSSEYPGVAEIDLKKFRR